MTEDAPLAPRDADDVLAAEYVLGVLALPDRVAAEKRLAAEPAFAAQVAAWESRLAALNDGFAEAPPPADMLDRIESRLFPAPRRGTPKWASSIWGWLAGALTAALAVLAVVALLPLVQPAPLVAVLGDGPALRVEARFADGAMTMTRVAGSPAPAGQVQEVWLIAPEAAPVSLGLLGDAPLTVPYPQAPEGWTLAISVEPAGGSPTGAPTGPVIAAGVIGDV